MTNDEKEIYLFAKKLYILYGDITIDIYKDEFWKYYENWKFSFSYLTFFRSKWFDGDVNDGYMEFSKKLIDTMREEN